jgi:hypothetical protein
MASPIYLFVVFTISLCKIYISIYIEIISNIIFFLVVITINCAPTNSEASDAVEFNMNADESQSINKREYPTEGILLGKRYPTEGILLGKRYPTEGILLGKRYPTEGILLGKRYPTEGILLGKRYPTEGILLGKRYPTEGILIGKRDSAEHHINN